MNSDSIAGEKYKNIKKLARNDIKYAGSKVSARNRTAINTNCPLNKLKCMSASRSAMKNTAHFMQ